MSVAEQQPTGLDPQARAEVYGQMLHDEFYAICKADMLVKGQAATAGRDPRRDRRAGG